MKFHILAIDYDNTLADDGKVTPATIDALVRLRKTGRLIVLVTGRLLKPLLDAFPEVGLCDLVVAENGALLYNPDTREERTLVDPPPPEFVPELIARGVPVTEVGKVIIATHVPHETVVLQTIRDQALELQIIFNKGAVMVLPTGVNKASGLKAAVKQLGYSSHNAVAIGDAENDEALIRLAEVGVAVHNAVEPLKKLADIVTKNSAGAGVVEIIEKLISRDLQEMHNLPGRGFDLGKSLSDEPISAPVYGTRMLVTGDSGGGKSMLAVSILDQLMKRGYQTCVLDPEGDFQLVEGAIVLGTRDKLPTAEEVVQVIRQPGKSCVVSLFAAENSKQPEIFSRYYRALQEHRLRTGRPHFTIIDEAHYPISPNWKPINELHLEDWRSVMYITAFPQKLPHTVLESINLFVAIADDPVKYLNSFCQLLGIPTPRVNPPEDELKHRALAWRRPGGNPFWVKRPAPVGEHQRHRHQYFEGDMEPADQFYFRGPKGQLNLGAGNLKTFMQLADGVDDETWLFHLQRGDYAAWFLQKVQDAELAQVADQLKSATEITAKQSRERIHEMIQKLYVKHA